MRISNLFIDYLGQKVIKTDKITFEIRDNSMARKLDSDK